MSWSFVQSAEGGFFGTTVTATFTTANVTSGNKIIAYVTSSWTDAPSSVKDGASNSWTLLGSQVRSGGGSVWLYALDVPAGDAGTKPALTATFPSSNGQAILIQEVSGLLAGNTTAMIDGSTAGLSGTTAATGSPTYSSTASNEYLVCAYGAASATTAPTILGGWTADPNNTGGGGGGGAAVVEYKNSTGGSETSGFTGADTAGWSILTVAFKLASVPVSSSALPTAPVPPGYRSPAAWKQFPYSRLGQTVTISGSGGVTVPKPSLAGTGTEGMAVTLPALQLMPPGALSPAAWQRPQYRRLGQTVTISGGGGVVVPKPSLAGTANETDSITFPAVQLMPPGALSPAAWQFPRYPRLGQTITISGSGGVAVPKPSVAGTGNVTRSVALPAVAPLPPGAVSPAAWQFPRYQRLGQTITIAGSGGVTVPKPSLAGTGIEFTETALPPLLPPGAVSPAAWQFPQYRRLGQTVTISGGGGVTVPKPSLAGTGIEGAPALAFPAVQFMPPGALSPAAWQRPQYRRLGQTVTISGSGGVAVPKPVLAGNGTQGAIPFTVPAVQPMPPGALSPAAWQRPQYRRLGQVITIQGSGGITVPKPALAGSGAVSVPSVFPAVQVTPPGYVSPAAWQAPRYVRAGQVTTISGSGGVIVPKPVLAGTGNATTNTFTLPAAQPTPPGALSPAAWQHPRYQRLGQTVTISGSGGVTVPKPALAGSGTVTAAQQWTLRQQAIPPGFTSPMAFQRAAPPRGGGAALVIPRPGTVTITDTAEYTVTITDEMIGAVTISNKINGTVTIGNAT